MKKDIKYENNNISFDEQSPKEDNSGIKCKNYELCNFECKGKYLCTKCDEMFGKVLEIHDNLECLICLEVTRSISQPNYEHTVCIDCFTRCYYNDDLKKPSFPYPDIEDKYRNDQQKLKWKTEYPLIKTYNKECDKWNDERAKIKEHYIKCHKYNIQSKMKDWGEIILTPIDSTSDFWCLIDELYDDNSEFIHNRCTILKAYKEGNLYGLSVSVNNKMYDSHARMDKIFCTDSWYLLPCFCVENNYEAIMIWTHTRARKMGFAKKLVELLQIKYAYHPLTNSLEFWKKCNVKTTS